MTTTTRKAKGLVSSGAKPVAAPRKGVAAQVVPRLSGINHLVIACHDMERALQFYCGILGMKVKCANGPTEEEWANKPGTVGPDGKLRAQRRFYWLEMANGDVLAVLEFPDFDAAAPPTFFGNLWPGGRPANPKPGGVDHIAFNVNSLEEQKALRQRLVDNNIPCSEITWSPTPTAVSSVWFYDPDGNAIEVATWNFDGPDWKDRTEDDWFKDGARPPSFEKNFEEWRVPLSWHHTSHPTK